MSALKLAERSRRLTGLVLMAALAVSVPAQAAESTFNSGPDGWGTTCGVTWVAAGGNPAGHMQFDDPGPADCGSISAPGSFLGNWLMAYGSTGLLSIDFALFEASQSPGPMEVRVFGTSGYIASNLSNIPGFWSSPFGWTTFTLSLDSPNWGVTAGTTRADVLSNVTDVRIIMSAGSLPDERTGIDNVRVRPVPTTGVPEPGTLALLGLGLAGLGLSRRHRTN